MMLYHIEERIWDSNPFRASNLLRQEAQRAKSLKTSKKKPNKRVRYLRYLRCMSGAVSHLKDHLFFPCSYSLILFSGYSAHYISP